MSNFEQIGIDRQYNATTADDAIKSFKRSCAICCNTGKHIECDKCHISFVHTTILSILL